MTEKTYLVTHFEDDASERHIICSSCGPLPDSETIAKVLNLDFYPENEAIEAREVEVMSFDDMLVNLEEREELERVAALPKKVKITAHLLVDTHDIRAEVFDGLNEMFRNSDFVLDWCFVPGNARAIDYDPENYDEGSFVQDERQAFIDANGGTWGAHNLYSKDGWVDEVASGDTVLGYWDWVLHQIESNGS